ncbi:MAG: cytochrome c peroxidase [Siphonobacter sp.]
MISLRMFFALGLVLFAAGKPSEDRIEGIKNQFGQQVMAFEKTAEALQQAVVSHPEQAPAAFFNARLAYKRLEWLLEAYYPSMARQLNGPPVDEVEMEDQVVVKAQGFQVIEEILFPAVDTTQLATLREECEKLVLHAHQISQHPWLNDVNDTHFWDALRLECSRIATLGITGYDSPAARYSLPEAVASLEGCERMLQGYRSDLEQAESGYWNRFERLLTQAKKTLQATSFDNFNQLDFLTIQLEPLVRHLEKGQKILHITSLTDRERLLNTNVWWIFDTNAFRPEVLNSYPQWPATPERIALGKRLFYEPALSGNNQRSCITCHQPGKALTDGLPRSLSLDNQTTLARNAPTLWNAGLQLTFFQDSRAFSLEMQLADVIRNPLEMNGSLEGAIRKLQKKTGYVQAFRKAYPNTTLSQSQLLNALASYLRSLVRLNSRWDRYMRGEHTVLTEREKRGFTLFAGKAKCATCHFLPLTSGMLPPSYDRADVEVLGVTAQADLEHPTLDSDYGAALLASEAILEKAFKTPTLRNVAQTAPYMHNGVFKTLEEVVEFYDRGGGQGLGLDVPNQTLAAEPLQLTVEEKADLVSFMKTLTDLPGAIPASKKR